MRDEDDFPPDDDTPDEKQFIGDDDFLAAFGEELLSSLNLETWDNGFDPKSVLSRFTEQVSKSVNKEEKARHIIRAELFDRIKAMQRAPGAGVHPATPERVRLIHETLLFPGHVEAVNSMVLSHDSLPIGISQIGVVKVSYQGTLGTFAQRFFRKEMSAQMDGYEQALALVEQRFERSGAGKRDVMPMLARRNIRAYAERAVLLDRSSAEWRVGYGNPFSREMLSGSGYTSLLTESLKLLRRLIAEQPKFVFVSDAMDDLGFMTLGNALNAGEYLIIDTLVQDSNAMVDRWNYQEQSRHDAFKFVAECAPSVLRGLFRASNHAPPYLFYAHRSHVHMAAHIAMADSILRAERGFPMLLDVADVACRGALGAEGFMGTVHDAFSRAGGNLQYLHSRKNRR